MGILFTEMRFVKGRRLPEYNAADFSLPVYIYIYHILSNWVNS